MQRASKTGLLLAILATAGCGKKEGEEAADSPGPPPVNAQTVATPTPAAEATPAAPDQAQQPAATIPLDPLGLVDEEVHHEPSKAPWQGEVFNDLAGEQLKQLGKALAHADKISGEELAPLIADSFQAHGLVPSPLEVSFEDHAFLVRRPAPGARNKDHADALSVMRDLAAPFAGATGVRSKFKVFTVELDEEGAPGSRIYFQISGHTPAGVLTRRATWQSSWSWPAPEEHPKLVSISVTEFEETLGKPGADAAPAFADCTGSVFASTASFREQLNFGIDYWANRLEMFYGIGQAAWHGLALGDANGDGLDDVYVCEPGGLPNRLYIRKPDGTLLDASSLSGTDFAIQTQSALFVDLDNDADQDLVLATTLGLMILENDGRGTFAVRSTKLIPEAAPLVINAADFDLDGDLDLFAGCYSLRREGEDGPQFHARPLPYHDANNGGRNALFRNDRNWRFRNTTKALGLDEDNRRFTLAASWEDYDQDGDSDLYVVNDFGRNCLYRNDLREDGSRWFTNVGAEAGVEDISAGMSSSWGDADGDGDQDLYVSNMWSSAGNRVTYQRNFQPGVDQSDLAEFQRHARGNSLFLNNGDGTFTDGSLNAGVTMGRWAWSSRFMDLNGDGWQDLVVANGFITQPDDTGDL